MGILGCFGSVLGWILLGIWFNLNWGENIFRVRKEKSKIIVTKKELKGIEKFFFIFGFFVVFALIMALINFIFWCV